MYQSTFSPEKKSEKYIFQWHKRSCIHYINHVNETEKYRLNSNFEASTNCNIPLRSYSMHLLNIKCVFNLLMLVLETSFALTKDFITLLGKKLEPRAL